jgi:hypothetical protein
MAESAVKCVIHRDEDALFNCYLCRNPICVDCARDLRGHSVCPICIARIEERKAAETVAETEGLKCSRACVVGLVAAGATAFAWSQFVLMTGRPLAVGAVAVAAFVAFAVMRGAGGKRGHNLQQMASLLTLAGILLGHFLILLRAAPERYAGLSVGGGDALGALYAFPGYLSSLGAAGWLFLVVGAALAYYLPHPRTAPTA